MVNIGNLSEGSVGEVRQFVVDPRDRKNPGSFGSGDEGCRDLTLGMLRGIPRTKLRALKGFVSQNDGKTHCATPRRTWGTFVGINIRD